MVLGQEDLTYQELLAQYGCGFPDLNGTLYLLLIARDSLLKVIATFLTCSWGLHSLIFLTLSFFIQMEIPAVCAQRCLISALLVSPPVSSMAICSLCGTRCHTNGPNYLEKSRL